MSNPRCRSCKAGIDEFNAIGLCWLCELQGEVAARRKAETLLAAEKTIRKEAENDLGHLRDTLQRECDFTKKLEAENVALKKRVEASALSGMQIADQFEKELHEAESHNADLRGALEGIKQGACANTSWPRDYIIDKDLLRPVDKALATTPTDSLARHDAAIKAEAYQHAADEHSCGDCAGRAKTFRAKAQQD